MELILDKLVEHGIAAIFLAATIYYFTKKEAKRDITDKEREKAHKAELAAKDLIIAEKDKKIEDCADARRDDSVSIIQFTRDLRETLKDLIQEIRK